MKKTVTFKCEVEYTLEYENDEKLAIKSAIRNIKATGWTTIHTKKVKLVEVIPENKLKTNFYKKYVGAYAKRFYTSFDEKNIFKIVGFKMKNGMAHFKMEDKTNGCFLP